ncbi:MAG: hypothetical protein KDD62_01165 [Bdellovibrionales bacterium]|nr:hypothetical protein [Bdellovibrionales bacterium]MCB0334873.1 hypothetical protein [Bdellovibrionales bacterium]
MKQRSKEEWKRLVAEQESSGLSQAKFCEKRGVTVASLGYWRKKLKEEAFVELSVAIEDSQSSGSAVVEFPGGAVLRFSW